MGALRSEMSSGGRRSLSEQTQDSRSLHTAPQLAVIGVCLSLASMSQLPSRLHQSRLLHQLRAHLLSSQRQLLPSRHRSFIPFDFSLQGVHGTNGTDGYGMYVTVTRIDSLPNNTIEC